jgi:hypothetical protein
MHEQQQHQSTSRFTLTTKSVGFCDGLAGGPGAGPVPVCAHRAHVIAEHTRTETCCVRTWRQPLITRDIGRRHRASETKLIDLCTQQTATCHTRHTDTLAHVRVRAAGERTVCSRRRSPRPTAQRPRRRRTGGAVAPAHIRHAHTRTRTRTRTHHVFVSSGQAREREQLDVGRQRHDHRRVPTHVLVTPAHTTRAQRTWRCSWRTKPMATRWAITL